MRNSNRIDARIRPAAPPSCHDGKLTSGPRFYTVSEVIADGFCVESIVLVFLPVRFRVDYVAE